MKIALLTAMEIERREIARLLANPVQKRLGGYDWLAGTLAGNEIFLTAGGIGKVNAALTAAAAFHTFAPDALVSTGCAGGLAANLSIGSVVAGSAYAYHDVDCAFGNVRGQVQGLPPIFEADPAVLAAARKTNAIAGLMVSGDQFITPGPRLDDIRSAFPSALACEMESAALAHACHLAKTPFISFRVISDTPGGEASKHIAQYENFWERLASSSFGVVRTFLESI